MKQKYLALSPFAIFLISLLFSATIVQVETGILTETRKSALITVVTQGQIGLHPVSLPSLIHNESSWDAYGVAKVLHIVKTLDALDKIDVEKAVNYLLEWLQGQHLRFDDSWPIPVKASRYYGLFVDFPPLDTTYFSVAILNVTDSLHLLNKLTPVASKAFYNLVILSIVTSAFSFLGMLIYEGIKWARRTASVLRTREINVEDISDGEDHYGD